MTDPGGSKREWRPREGRPNGEGCGGDGGGSEGGGCAQIAMAARRSSHGTCRRARGQGQLGELGDCSSAGETGVGKEGSRAERGAAARGELVRGVDQLASAAPCASRVGSLEKRKCFHLPTAPRGGKHVSKQARANAERRKRGMGRMRRSGGWPVRDVTLGAGGGLAPRRQYAGRPLPRHRGLERQSGGGEVR